MTVMTNTQRAAERERILRDCLAQAHALAATRGRTMKCGGWRTLGWEPRHAADPEGCRNDGSGCICECHDAPEPLSASQVARLDESDPYGDAVTINTKGRT